MKLRRKMQKSVQAHCEKMLTDAQRQAERESIEKIEAYKKYEKHVYRRIEKERQAAASSTGKKMPDHSHLEKELDQAIKQLQTELLAIEMKLQDALLISRKQYF